MVGTCPVGTQDGPNPGGTRLRRHAHRLQTGGLEILVTKDHFMNVPNRWAALSIMLGIALLCGGIVVLILIPGRTNRWRSSPAVPRQSPIYQAVLRPARLPPPIGPFDARSVVVRTNGNEITIEVAQSMVATQDDRVYGYTLHQAGSDQRAAFPGGSVGLTHLGVGYGVFPLDDPQRDSVSVPARFFDAHLRALEPKRLQELLPSERDRSLYFRGDFPEVRFFFAIEGPSEFKILNLQIFDARTHRSLLGGGYSSGAGERGSFWVGTRVQLWQQSPVLVVVSLAHGPTKANLVEAAVGTTAKHEQGELHLVAVLDKTELGWSSESGQGKERLKLRLADAVERNRPTQTTLVWYAMPQAGPFPLELDYLDQDGNEVAGLGGGSSGAFLLGGVAEAAQKVSSVRIRSFPHVRRLVFYLPEIPGLPEENRGVQNLFDVRIPYLRVNEDWRLREFLGNVTQLEPRFSQTPSTAPGFFPFTRTNVLAREVVAQYEAALAGKQLFRVSRDGQQFIMKPPPHVRLLKQWQEFLDKVF